MKEHVLFERFMQIFILLNVLDTNMNILSVKNMRKGWTISFTYGQNPALFSHFSAFHSFLMIVLMVYRIQPWLSVLVKISKYFVHLVPRWHLQCSGCSSPAFIHCMAVLQSSRHSVQGMSKIHPMTRIDMNKNHYEHACGYIQADLVLITWCVYAFALCVHNYCDMM